MLPALLFDLDGTLVDSLSVTFEAFRKGIEAGGGPSMSPPEIMAHFGPGERQIFAKIVGENRADEAYSVARAHLVRELPRAPLFDGVTDLLEALRSQGARLGIVTGRGWDTTDLLLRHHAIAPHFDLVLANDHVPRPKPDPSGLLLALKRLGIAAEDTLYVGDTHFDIRAARGAGVPSVAALWDQRATREELGLHQPDHFAERPMDVLVLAKRRAEP